MDARGLPVVSPGIDFAAVDPMNHRRLLSFVNHFVAHSISFLNKFACSCENRLEESSVRGAKVEATLQILEAKLASIAGLENANAKAPPVSDKPETATGAAGSAGIPPPPPPPPPLPGNEGPPPPLPPSEMTEPVSEEVTDSGYPPGFLKAKDHPDYRRYFKMITMGVPLQAAKNQMAAEIQGSDVSVLEHPDQMVEYVEPSSDSEMED